MSIPVDLAHLRAVVAERGGNAYVLTTSDDGRPHAVHAPVRWRGESLTAEVGQRTAANAAARPEVSLLFPIRTDDDYSLIVDGTATLASTGDRRELIVAPTRAVLHRAAPAPDPTASSCGADCIPVLPPAARTRARDDADGRK